MHSYLVKYKVSTIAIKSDIIFAETVDKAILEVMKKENALKVVSIKKLGVPPKPSLREPGCFPTVEMVKLYTKLDATTDPDERAKIIAELEQIKNGEW